LVQKLSLKNIKKRLLEIVFFTADFIVYYLFSKKNKKEGNPRIIYLGEYFPVRIQRIVKYLKREIPAEFILYISKWGYEPKLIGTHFSRIEVYRNKFHLLRKIKMENNIRLIHSFEPKAYYQYLVLEAVKAPFIYDIQDILINYFGYHPPKKWQKKNLVFEKKVLQLSDGLISHSMELNEALRNYRIKKKNSSLFFPLYCDEENFKPIKPRATNVENINIVYIGGVNGPDEKTSSNFLPLIKKLNGLEVGFTIFPSPISEQNFYSEYKAMETKFPYFKMERSVAFDKLDISNYDFGVLPFEHETSENYYSKNLYASTMKFFVYLEMGIPVMISEYWRFPAWLTKRYKLGIVSSYNDLEQLPQILSRTDINSLKNNIGVFREKFGLKKNIPRIRDYYHFLISQNE
jgi:hypothetical protein